MTRLTRAAPLSRDKMPRRGLAPPLLFAGFARESELLSNQVRTVAWYVLGGLAAAATATWLANRRAETTREFVGGY